MINAAWDVWAPEHSTEAHMVLAKPGGCAPLQIIWLYSIDADWVNDKNRKFYLFGVCAVERTMEFLFHRILFVRILQISQFNLSHLQYVFNYTLERGCKKIRKKHLHKIHFHVIIYASTLFRSIINNRKVIDFTIPILR